jgi:hypothetical protein
MEDPFDEKSGDVRGETVNLQNGGARDVYASTVTLTRGGARNVQADTVTVKQAGVQKIEAQKLTLKQGGALQVSAEQSELIASGAGLIRADTVRIGPGCRVGGVLTNSATIEESVAPAIIARQEARIDQSAVGVLVSNRVTLSSSMVGVAVAETVEGDVRVQVKPKVAAVFGAAFGGALGLLMLIGRRGR